MDKVNKTEEQWRLELTPEQFAVCRRQGTERPFTGIYVDNKADGVYRCVCCNSVLFDSRAKYESGSGWPSFWEPSETGALRSIEDLSHGMRRIEVRCGTCDAHLGHVFPDGPKPTGLRYCINSVALSFEAR